MPQRESSGSRTATVLLLVLGAFLGTLAFWPDVESRTATTNPTAGPHAPQQHAPHALPGNDAVHAPRADPERTDVTQRVERPNAIVFEECVARLTELGLRTAELAQNDEIEAAQQLNRQVGQLLDDVLAAFADAGERSLAMLVGMAGGPRIAIRPPHENTKLGVLQLLIQLELERRQKVAAAASDRTRVDVLTQALLDAMPIDDRTASMGERCLYKRPYLRLTHEASILRLLQLASDGEFPRDIATRMLLTLWDNLAANGERSSHELSRLAMMRLDSTDPSEVVAACRQLLADERYRAIVLSWLRDRKDRKLALDIAQLAARELPVDDAILVLGELAPLLDNTRGTYMALGIRSPHAVSEAYRRHLAANTQPDVRRELIMGVGMIPGAAGMPVAELALANDPSPDVRIQAMYVYTVQASPEAAEQAINDLLDDPAIANDKQRLGSIVLALQNLEHGDPNRIHRLATRLQSLPLADYSKLALEQILSRCLPGGAPTRGG